MKAILVIDIPEGETIETVTPILRLKPKGKPFIYDYFGEWQPKIRPLPMKQKNMVEWLNEIMGEKE